MAALSDHARRDAEHWARITIAGHVQMYVRRLTEFSKTDIKEALDAAAQSGGDVDAIALGRAAADRAFHFYGFGVEAPQAALESRTDPGDGFA